MPKVGAAPVPDFVERIAEEVHSAEPPAYTSQSKPKGRKTKKKAASNGTDPVSVTKSKAKRGKNKRKVLRKASSKGQRGKKNRGNSTGEEAIDGDQPMGDPSGPSASSPPEPVPKAAAKAKRKSKAKRKPEPLGAEASEVVDVEATEASEPLGDEPFVALPEGMAYPPPWVEAGNVYSNSYRRAKAKGLKLDDVKAHARDCTERFRLTRAVDQDLVGSFSLFKPENKRKPRKPKGADMEPVQDGSDGQAKATHATE